MNVYDAIMKRRTIRKFEQKAVSEDNLVKLVDCARVAAYGANVQPLKFMIVNNSEDVYKRQNINMTIYKKCLKRESIFSYFTIRKV